MGTASDDFVHLHCHTDYSLLDGAAQITPLVAEASRLGQRALAITDHGYLFGAYEFYQACTQAGIKPIIGLEAYVTPGTSRFDKTRVQWGESWQAADDVSARGAYTHLTLLARTTEGMHNLFRMGSKASLEGQMGKWPRIDRELLQTYSTGLISSTGCPSGEVQTRLRLGQYDEALKAAGELQDIFGKEYFFVELMDHGLELENRVRAELLDIAKALGAPLVATNDSHYVTKDDAATQDALLCISTGSVLSDPDRFRFDGSGYYLKSGAEMRKLFSGLPQACDNTLKIAEMCEVEFSHSNYMPRFEVPAGETEESWFIKEVEAGLHYRFGDSIPEEVRKQAEHEISVIVQMGFPGYFLVVSDYIRWAKERGIRVGPGRGSGAGSMVAYALRITDLDPLKNGLIFERFLNPERVSMPDFDVDFDDRRRGEVIDYVTEKYGNDRVSAVVTYNKLKAKAALKDAARVMGYPYQFGDRLTKAMPPAVMGKDIPLSGIFDPSHKRYAEAEEFRKLVKAEPEAQKIVDLAKGLEGITRQWSVHACAIIMSSEPLENVIPLMIRPSDNLVITQFDYGACESLGLLKMDFLGLRNLTVIDDAIENITANGKHAPDLETLPLDDKKTYELMADAATLGVFQLDGAGMRSLLRQMCPDNFEDISAVGALYRPGPMGANSHVNYAKRKNGLQEIDYIDPELAEPLHEILGPTYGLIVYQEQVMAIAQKLAGFTLGQADLLRRAMGKKKKEVLDAQFEGFLQGMTEHGYSKRATQKLWDILVPFSDYAFNKAHSAAYGVVSYWTAYLKAHYPSEYMAALLTSQRERKDKLALYLGECRRMGVTVLPPDINTSVANFAAVGDDVRVGLGAVRNVGEKVVDAIIATREEKGEFESFQDFLDKVPITVCNKRTIESLIKAGAFDRFGHSRRALVARHEEAVDSVVGLKRNEASGQFDLFGSLGEEARDDFTVDIPDIPEWEKSIKLGFEREMIGLYVSDHPLAGVSRILQRAANTEIGELVEDGERRDGDTVTVAGLITAVTTRTNKKGELWASLTLEDLSGTVEVLAFSKTYREYLAAIVPDTIVVINGRVSMRDEEVAIFAREIKILDVAQGENLPVRLHVPYRMCTVDQLEKMRDELANYQGKAPIDLVIHHGPKHWVVRLPDEYSVQASESFYGAMKALWGPGVTR